jgi:hypothetical protein
VNLRPEIGTFSLPVPGPVNSADTLGGQGGPRSRSKPLQEKDFRATYCPNAHCWSCPRLSALAEKVPEIASRRCRDLENTLCSGPAELLNQSAWFSEEIESSKHRILRKKVLRRCQDTGQARTPGARGDPRSRGASAPAECHKLSDPVRFPTARRSEMRSSSRPMTSGRVEDTSLAEGRQTFPTPHAGAHREGFFEIGVGGCSADGLISA